MIRHFQAKDGEQNFVMNSVRRFRHSIHSLVSFFIFSHSKVLNLHKVSNLKQMYFIEVLWIFVLLLFILRKALVEFIYSFVAINT